MIRTVLLGDIADVLNGVAFSSRDFVTEERAKEGDLPVFKMGNLVIGGGIRQGKDDYIPIEKLIKLKRQITQPYDILMCMTDMKSSMNLLGYSGQIKDEVFAVNQRVGIIRPKKDLVEPTFLYYYLNSPYFIDKIRATANSGVQVNLSTAAIRNIEIDLPEWGVQASIARTIGAIDEKIELNRKMNETLEQMGRALFRHYFINNPDSEKWEDGVIADLVNIYSGYAFKRTDFDSDGKYGLVTIKNVQDGNFVSECSDHLNAIPVKVPTNIHLKTGDILLSLTGNVGRVCIAYGENLLLNQRVAKLAGVDGCYSFTYFLFRQNEFKERLISMSRGTAQLNLSPVETKQLKTKLPPKDVLEHFYMQAEPLFETITANYEQIQTLTALRDTLLPRLINGKVKV